MYGDDEALRGGEAKGTNAASDGETRNAPVPRYKATTRQTPWVRGFGAFADFGTAVQALVLGGQWESEL